MPESRPTYATLALRNEVTDVRDSTILSVTSEASQFRKNELISPLRSRRWRSTSNAQQEIVGQFAASIVPRQLVLIDSNLNTPAGNITDALAALVIYLRAYDINQSDNTAVASWTSVGTTAAAFAQGTGANQATYQTGEIDNKAIVRFDGSNDFFDYATTLNMGTVHTIVVVVKLTTVGATQNRILGNATEHVRVENNVLYYANSGGSTVSVAWTPTASQWYVIRVVRNGTSVSFYVDGTQVGATQTLAGNTSFVLRYIGTSLTSTIHGDLAEVMIATSSTFELLGYGRALEDFLYARYRASTAATGLTTMALTSLLVELHTSSAFGSLGMRWALQSYAQTNRRTLCWYIREPDSIVPASTAALRRDPSTIYDVFFPSSFWRLTLPSGCVLDSDADGVIDTYHELGTAWFGNYTELPIDFGLQISVQDPSFVSESDSGARFVDRLTAFHEIDFSATANLEAVSYPLLAQIDAAGSSRLCVLDIWGPRSDLTMRAMGCYYGHFDKGVSFTRAITGRDDLSANFIESRA